MAAKYHKHEMNKQVIFDTHAHVTDRSFDKDRIQVIKRAQNLGVTFMEVGIDEKSSFKSLALAEKIDGVCAVGIHPHYASRSQDIEDRWNQIENIVAQSQRVKAIGEIGLDYFRNLSPKEAQIKCFEMGLDVANRCGLPVIIHERESSDDVVSVARKHMIGTPLIFHCFSGGIDHARKCLDLGGYLGFGGPLTYPRNGYLRDMLKFLPSDRLLVETDCPYLPPQSLRGKRNEPSYIIEVVNCIAEILDKKPWEISNITLMNALRVFAIEGHKW